MIDEAYLVSVLERLVKKIVNEQVRPSGFTVGTVTATNPLKVKIAGDLELPESVLIPGDQFKKLSLSTSDGMHTVVFDNSLNTGDKVRLLSDTGGQKYFILGRV